MQLPTQLSRRRADSHKGDFGHILILAGSRNFSGAALLSAHAAIRAGAGLVTLGLPQSINRALIKRKYLEIMTLPLPQTREGSLSLKSFSKIIDFTKKSDILAIGPGLSQNKSTQALIRKLVEKLRQPLVIDADGINALVGELNKFKIQNSKFKNRIITPHPGEMARLLGISVNELKRNRKALAKKFAKDYNLTLVLKGAHTLVTDYSGKLYINESGNPGMATAGSGDVLSGIIAAFLAQGLDEFRAAKYAVYLHGRAGDLAARQKTQLGMIASDIIDNIPRAIKSCSIS